MTNYSRMSYAELRKLVDNDSIADNMPDEEYESLSAELWRKFSVEKVIASESTAPRDKSQADEFLIKGISVCSLRR